VKLSCQAILVAIPDKALLELIGEVIEYLGHNPVLCVDETSVFEELSREIPFAVVVFDWELTKRNYPDILIKIRELYPKMSRLVFSDQSNGEVKDCIASGDFSGHVKKPFELKNFETALTECIKKYNSAWSDH
jgi:DNA-binding NtrC family response regulator